MNHAYFAIALSLGAALSGCATDGPATSGASVRAIVASQTALPTPARQEVGVDGAAAVETYKNYVDSYNNPRPHSAGSAFSR
jgi:hypothetical protein